MPPSSRSRRNARILASVFLFPLLVLAALFLFLRSSGFKSAAADPAIYKAQTSQAMVALIGAPIEPGWPIRGTLHTRKGSGSADLRIAVSGPRSKGTLLEWAQQQQSKWHLCSLVFRNTNGTILTLVDSSTTHCEPE